tara:strand:- start:180 stop:419 length:240 start_codon:yes stop_codon:yes gene_type:complete
MKSKFKIGDLVMLSAAGHKARQNEECRGGFGFIETIDEDEMKWKIQTHAYPIKTKWWTKDMKILNVNFKPYELKFFKNK